MNRHFIYHDEGYIEVLHSDYTLGDAFHYTDEAVEAKRRIPAPPEGYHLLEDLTNSKKISPASLLIVRTLLQITPIHCSAIFGGAPEISEHRMEAAKQAGKADLHHVFKTREEAVDWLTKNHNFKKPENAPIEL